LVPTQEEIQAIYQRHARRYDLYVRLYGLLGFRYNAYRLRAIKLLHLNRADSVVDLGCGTGLNFHLLEEQIGVEGRLMGVDLSSEMLACAEERAHRAGWTNVELVQSDMASYDFPELVNGVLSTGALGYVPEFDQVIERASRALVPGGRLVIWDLKQPERWPSWLLKLFFVWLGRPFGVTPDYVANRPWESVERHFEETTFEQLYWGGVYISSGAARSPTS
jgi:demethylmenaquinone methyltransferase/2-methoxy-6-polyprenyl-1,4-benzoquinol methylase